MTLSVWIEIKGKNVLVEYITGNNSLDAEFSYDQDYMSMAASRPISISLPFSSEPYDSEKTSCFLMVYCRKDTQDVVLLRD